MARTCKITRMYVEVVADLLRRCAQVRSTAPNVTTM